MVQEIRKIILSPEELVSAFESYRRMTPNFLPSGKITGCKTLDDGSVVVRMETLSDTETLQTEFTFRGLDVLKPLIRFCLENNIVLPKVGQKSYSVTEGSPTLSVSLNLKIDLPAGTALLRTSHLKDLTEVPVKDLREDTFVAVT